MKSRTPLMFHHVGVACESLDIEIPRWAALGYAPAGERFEDPAQGIRGVFLTGQSPRLELLEPLDPRVPGALGPWLKSATKLYHLAYEVPSLRTAIQELRAGRAKLMVEPVASVAFGGRDIAFLMLANRMLIELIDGGTA